MRLLQRETTAWYRAFATLLRVMVMFRYCGYGRSSWPRVVVAVASAVPANSGIPKNGLGTDCVSSEPSAWYFGSSWLMLIDASDVEPRPRRSDRLPMYPKLITLPPLNSFCQSAENWCT